MRNHAGVDRFGSDQNGLFCRSLLCRRVRSSFPLRRKPPRKTLLAAGCQSSEMVFALNDIEHTGPKAAATALDAEEQWRAELYLVVARLLGNAPDQDILDIVGTAVGGSGPVGNAIDELAAAARRYQAADVAEEYQNIFIGLGRGEIVPYASYYLTGFLQEKPLASLRRDLAAMGLGASPGNADPEDHAAAILEVMGRLVAGGTAAVAGLEAERTFFNNHIGAWMPIFFRDLEKARSARFYRAVGALGAALVAVEKDAFQMAA